jgi:hypothetical protein
MPVPEPDELGAELVRRCWRADHVIPDTGGVRSFVSSVA